MRILNVVPDISLEANGVTPVLEALSNEFILQGHHVGLATIAARGGFDGVQMEYGKKWKLASRFEISTELACKVRKLSAEFDIVHNHSLWSMINVASGYVVPGKRARLVVSPHGTLAAVSLRRSSGVKALIWPLQKRALLRADLLHATSEDEVNDIRRLGFRAPIALIPNGMYLADEVAQVAKPKARKTLLFLSRIHPQKGLENLLTAWRQIEGQFAQWDLIIAGVGEAAYVSSVKSLAASLGVVRVVFCGPLYDLEKSAAYTNADLFILPSYSENFGMVVAEALAHGCPVIVGVGAPWSQVVEHNCGWWVKNDSATLAEALQEAMRSDDIRLKEMGRNGRALIGKEFLWDAIAKKFDDAYRWILGEGEKPVYIREWK